MARPKKIEVGVINITTHPHSPEGYLNLFYDVVKEKRVASYRGAESLMLGSFGKIEGKPAAEGIWGNIYLFVEIDNKAPVLDIDTGQPIVSEDGEVTFPVPEKLKPNLKCIEFVFFPDGHRLFFNISSAPLRHETVRQISPNSLAASLEKLFYSENLYKNYGTVNVVAEKDSKLIDDILNIQHITRLFVDMALPNGDDVSRQKKRILDKLKYEKAKKYQVQLVGDKKDGLRPSEETIAIMEIATSNGKIAAEGYTIGEKVSISTFDHPILIRDRYNKETESSLRAVLRLAKNSLSKFTKRK